MHPYALDSLFPSPLCIISHLSTLNHICWLISLSQNILKPFRSSWHSLTFHYPVLWCTQRFRSSTTSADRCSNSLNSTGPWGKAVAAASLVWKSQVLVALRWPTLHGSVGTERTSITSQLSQELQWGKFLKPLKIQTGYTDHPCPHACWLSHTGEAQLPPAGTLPLSPHHSTLLRVCYTFCEVTLRGSQTQLLRSCWDPLQRPASPFFFLLHLSATQSYLSNGSPSSYIGIQHIQYNYTEYYYLMLFLK